jgi:hypothetical protein
MNLCPAPQSDRLTHSTASAYRHFTTACHASSHPNVHEFLPPDGNDGVHLGCLEVVAACSYAASQRITSKIAVSLPPLLPWPWSGRRSSV